MIATKGMPISGTQFASSAASPATQVAQPSPNAPVDSSVVMADFARRLRELEKSIKLQVPNDRILSAIALTTDTCLISSDKVAIIGEVTFADWHRDVSGTPSGTLDPGITQIRGGVIRTGMIENLAATSWVNLDAAGPTNFIQCGSAIAIGANGRFTFGDATTGRQFSYDGTNIGLGGSVVNLQTGHTLSAIDSNATYGATRSVGDITADVLTYSGTITNTVTATLFKFTNTVGGHGYEFGIGAGGFYGKKDGADMFSATTATGEGRFSGRFTSGSVFADGSVSSGLGAGQAAGVFLGSGSVRGLIATNGAYITGTVYADNFVTTSGALPNAGHANTADSLSSPLPLTGLAVGSTANFSVSSDGGATWTPFKFRRDA